MHAFQCTRSDIVFAISKLRKFTNNSSKEYWKAIGRVLSYLKKMKNISFQYSKFPGILEGFTNANWLSISYLTLVKEI